MKLQHQVFVLTGIALLWCSGAAVRPVSAHVLPLSPPAEDTATQILPVALEVPDDLPLPREDMLHSRVTSPAKVWTRGGYQSVQVNVYPNQHNILGDAANEPSIAVDPTNPSRIVIGWRQFDTVESNFREAGWAYSHDAGQTWMFPGVLEEGQFRSDPVVEADADGNFYFYSLSSATSAEMFKSVNGGMSWTGPVLAFGGDKQWMVIDKTAGIGRNNIYGFWNSQFSCCPPYDFTRSTNSALWFEAPLSIPEPKMKWGTMDVGPEGELFLCGSNLGQSAHLVAKSSNARDASQVPTFDFVQTVNLGGTTEFGGVNPAGLLGQVWIAVDRSTGGTRGNVYMLGSVVPPTGDPLELKFIRSTDGGMTWSDPVRVNDDPPDNGAYQWFGTMSVAPNGRIDVIWNDTRHDPSNQTSELYYAHSYDAGATWSVNEAVSPSFRQSDGYPQQAKLGDYYDMESDNLGVSVAYAATFNGEEDVYYLRIGSMDCNRNGIPDPDDITNGTSADCDGNELPDECEPDCNRNGIADPCDVRDGTSPDCDGNRVPDECDPDFDGDGTVDGCDPDIDEDGVANETDVCDFTPLGMPVDRQGRFVSDTVPNCVIDLLDAATMIGCLTNGGPGVPLARGCTTPFDYDGDRDVDLANAAILINTFGG